MQKLSKNNFANVIAGIGLALVLTGVVVWIVIDSGELGNNVVIVESHHSLQVHVVGEVELPGLYSLPVGSRISDAIDAAGGFTDMAAPDSVNLARRLVDGELLTIAALAPPVGDNVSASASSEQEEHAPGSSPPSNPTPASASATITPVATAQPAPNEPQNPPEETGDALVDLNTANAEELTILTGIGPKTAETIVEWRQSYGWITTVDELEAVKGIGPKTIDNIRSQIVPHQR